MRGMSAITGAALAGDAHLVQSVGDILSTPIGTRTMLRDYGSALSELHDQPLNPLGRLRVFAAVADALRRWEPRLRLTRVGLAGSAEQLAAGAATLELEGERTDDPSPTGLARLSIPLQLRTA